MLDITETTAPRSDQQNYEDYISGPKTVTVSEVRRGSAEQPVEIHLEEFPGRPFKPSKTVRRILVAAWGPDASQYVGRRMTLFGDPTVKWAGQAVGGIRVSHLSHIDKPLKLMLAESKGKRTLHTVQPLKESAPPKQKPATITDEQVADLVALMDRKGAPADKRVAFAAWATQSDVARLEDLTPNELAVVIDALAQKPDAAQPADDAGDPWAGGEQA